MENEFALTVAFTETVNPFYAEAQADDADVFVVPEASAEAPAGGDTIHGADGSEFTIVDGFIVYNGLQIEAFGSIEETLAAYGGAENLKIGLELMNAQDDYATYAIIMGAVDGVFA